MSKETLENSETQSDLDTSAALADISSELFGQDDGGDGQGADGSAEGEQAPVAVPPGSEAVEAAPQPDAGENAEAVQEVGAPKTWSKEALADWATLPPRAQQEILKREEDFLRGITQYKGAAEVGQRYEQVVEPYRMALQAENVDPVQLFQSFAANHYLLSRGTPQQKLDLAASLITGYGIDFTALARHLGDAALNRPDPNTIALRQELSDLRGKLTAREQQERTAAQQAVEAEVNAFASDPAHPYFDELVDDIAKLMQTGLATSLSDAYDRAVYANPVTRQKEIDRLAGEKLSAVDTVAKARQDKIARAQAADVKTTPTQRNGTVPTGSMDDTLQETLAAISARG